MNFARKSGAVGGTYTFATEVAANLREKRDAWNPTIGGALAGAVLGMRSAEYPNINNTTIITATSKQSQELP